MNSNKVLVLTGYDYSHCFSVLDGLDFKVLIPSDEPLLANISRKRLRDALDEKLVDVAYSNVVNFVKEFTPDFLITFGWRRIVPDELISLARVAINIHPALLPEYKGYHPVPYVLINNEEYHGVTAHVITSKLDAGSIVHQEKFPINKFSTLNELQSKVNDLMPSFFSRLLEKILNDNYSLSENDESKTKVVAGKRIPKDSEVPLHVTVGKAYDLIRACDSERFPAFINIDGTRFNIRLEKVDN